MDATADSYNLLHLNGEPSRGTDCQTCIHQQSCGCDGGGTIMFQMFGWYDGCGAPEVINIDAWEDVLMMMDWLESAMYHTVMVTHGYFDDAVVVLNTAHMRGWK